MGQCRRDAPADDRLREREARGLANLVRADMNNLQNLADAILGQMEGADNATVLDVLRTLADTWGSTLSDFAAQRSELRMLPRPILDPVFFIISTVRDLEWVLTQSYTIEAPQRLDELDDETRVNLTDLLQLLSTKADEAKPILARYADTGEIPEN